MQYERGKDCRDGNSGRPGFHTRDVRGNPKQRDESENSDPVAWPITGF